MNIVKDLYSKIFNPRNYYSIGYNTQNNPDRLIGNASADYEKYLDMMYVNVVAKNDMASKAFATAFSSSINQGEATAQHYDYIKDLWNGEIEGIDLKALQSNILDYILCGYSVIQFIEGKDSTGQKTIIDGIAQPQNFFDFTPEGQLKTVNTSINGGQILDQDLEFLVTRDKISGGNFYGVGVAKSIYYDVQVLKDLKKFLHQTASKYAVPPLVVIHENMGNKQADVTATAKGTSTAFQKLRSGSAVSISKVKDIKELKGGNIVELSEVVREFEARICERYNGNSDLLMHFGGGSLAKTETLHTITKEYAKERNRILEKALNEVISRIIKVRFNKDAKAPKISFDREEKADPEMILKYYTEGIKIKTDSLPDFTAEEEETVQKINQPEVFKSKNFKLKI